jgi:hypothetical protein
MVKSLISKGLTVPPRCKRYIHLYLLKTNKRPHFILKPDFSLGGSGEKAGRQQKATAKYINFDLARKSSSTGIFREN